MEAVDHVRFALGEEDSDNNIKIGKIMKKICLIIAMLWVNVMACMSQTYYYKYLYTVNKQTGAKSSPGDGKTGMYITFTNNKSNCYHSDKNGNVYKPNRGPYAPATDERMEIYNYESSNNGILVYRQTKVELGFGMAAGGWGTYSFSSDYNRMNSNLAMYDLANDIKVYERSTPPEQQTAPQQLY